VIRAIRVFESPQRRPEDEVSIVHFVAEGMRLVFLGDLGHALLEAEIEPIQGAEIVLIPAGGPPTIDYPEIPGLLQGIGPRIVIPMHYKTPKINLNIQPIERFFASLPGVPVDRREVPYLDITPAQLPAQMRVVALAHAR
jgi:L-ascorbate metabolism protein UlaG (beta-lactamase superfamily)